MRASHISGRSRQLPKGAPKGPPMIQPSTTPRPDAVDGFNVDRSSTAVTVFEARGPYRWADSIVQASPVPR